MKFQKNAFFYALLAKILRGPVIPIIPESRYCGN
jgi:hypothetical protein